jgi:hypothetical protein
MLTCRLDLRVEVEDDTSELGVVSEISHRSVATGNEDTREALQLLVGDRSEGAGVVQIVLNLHLLDELGLLWRVQVVLETNKSMVEKMMWLLTLFFSHHIPRNARGRDFESGSMLGCLPSGDAN